jgi:hypothetical protein
MERPLYAPVAKAAIDSSSIQPADEEADLAALLDASSHCSLCSL